MSADIFFGNDIAVDPAAPVILSKAKTFCWGHARKISVLRGFEIFSPCGRRPSVHFNFTLNQLSYILIVFVLSCTFWKKVRKTSAHGKNLHKRPLFTLHTVSPQSGTCSSLQAFAMQNLGCTRHNISKLIFCSHLHEISLVFRVLRNLICTAIQGKLYPCKSSDSPRTMACRRQGSPLCCLRCRFRWISFVHGLYAY